MKTWARIKGRGRRGWQISRAFLEVDLIDATNYPLAIVMKGLSAFVPVVTFKFVADLMGDNGPDVAFDYYTFVVIGVATMTLLAATLNSFGNALLRLVTQGQLEMYLVEPVPWRMLPFLMLPWPGAVAIGTAGVMVLLSIPLGADYNAAGIPAAIAIVILGLIATLAVGILGASVRVLSKRADPILSLYTIAASVLSGAFFPVEELPDWLQALSWVIPHTYVIQALRRVLMPEGAVLGGATAGQAMVALAVFALIFYPIALWFFGRTLEYGRKIGALSGY
jgi:ABC-2 type transport system permease protein